MTVKTPQFKEAHAHMRMLSDAAIAIGYSHCESAWGVLTGQEAETTPVSDAIVMTLPVEHAPLMRIAGGIPAAVFIAILGRYISDVDIPNTSASELRFITRKAWVEFDKRAKTADTIQRGFGWDLSDAWQTTVEIEEKVWNSKTVEQVARLAGRMYEVLRGVRRMVPDALPQEVKSVTLGGDIERLMPVEHALLASPETADMKAIDILQGKAQQLRVAGEKPAARGPLVICIDESGSMWGHRNTWAKSCLAALVRVAHEENRMVHVVHFATGVVARQVAPRDSKAVLSAIACFLDGGTEIGNALHAGNKQVEVLDKSGYSGADVVLITDGTDPREGLQESAIEALKAKGTRLWTLGIGVHIRKQKAIRREASAYIQVNTESVDDVKGLALVARGDRK